MSVTRGISARRRPWPRHQLQRQRNVRSVKRRMQLCSGFQRPLLPVVRPRPLWVLMSRVSGSWRPHVLWPRCVQRRQNRKRRMSMLGVRCRGLLGRPAVRGMCRRIRRSFLQRPVPRRRRLQLPWELLRRHFWGRNVHVRRQRGPRPMGRRRLQLLPARDVWHHVSRRVPRRPRKLRVLRTRFVRRRAQWDGRLPMPRRIFGRGVR
jgi:hypothetical protein